jgi:N-acetylneuraminic acid mutarotase/PKD repeat protein
MKKYLILLCLTYSFNLSAQNLTWLRKTSLPQLAYSPASFTIGTNIYVIGGITDPLIGAPPHGMSKAVWQYNTITDVWTRKNDFPGKPMYGASGFMLNNLGYVLNGWDSVGGTNGSNTLWCYNPITDTWTTKATFTGGARYTAAHFTLNGKAYITCGYAPYYNDTYSYNPATNSWSTEANFPGIARQALVYFAIGNFAYVGMGATTGDYLESDWYKFDGTTWTRLNNFPFDPITSSYNVVLNNEAYIVNGLKESNLHYTLGASKEVWKYTPSTDSWSLWGLFPDTAIFEGASGVVNNVAYLGLGATNHYTYPGSSVWWSFGAADSTLCNAAVNSLQINNSTFNFQASGSFTANVILNWDFGDSTSGTGSSIIHNYSQLGTYVVSLSVNDSTGQICNTLFTDTVSVTNVSNCNASITHVNINEVFTLQGHNYGGSGSNTYLWSSPDDSTFTSTLPNPTVLFSPFESKTYCVTITDTTGCVSSACDTITYTPSSSFSCQAFVSVVPDSSIPGLYYGTVYSYGSNLTYFWSFGDGATSTLQFPTHTYATPGKYTICLTVSNNNGCNFTFCDSSFYTYKMGGGPMSQFNVVGRGVLGISDNEEQAYRVRIYPNPTSAIVSFDAKGKIVSHVTIYSVQGQKVADDILLNNSLNVSELAKGIYYLDLKIEDSIVRMKLVKE